MSFVVTVPEAVAAAAGDLAAIGSTLREATAAAAGPTTGLAAAAADDVSIAVSQLFGRYGQEFQTVSNQLAAFHTEFVRTLNRGAAAYLNTESANGGQLFGQIEAGQRAVSAAAAAAPGGAYGQLVANTATNLESLYGAWSANPFPFLRQIIANQQVYWQQIAAALANAVQNFPALVANLPAAIDAAVQQFLAFNAAYYIQQIISSQIGFAQLFATTVGQGVTSVIAGWPNLAAELQLAFQQLLVGDYNAAVANLGKAMTNLLVTGFDTSDVTIGTMGTTISVTAKPKLLGPLGDLFTIMTIPAQEAQYFTNLMPPSILRDMSQNFTNVLTTLSNPNIQAVASFDTRCSMTAGIKASSTWPVRPRRKFGSRRCAAATAGCSGTKSLASSAAPSMAGAMSTNSSAPLPHATQRAASRPARLIRAVTGPVGSKLVRQIVPSPGTRKHGSC